MPVLPWLTQMVQWKLKYEFNSNSASRLEFSSANQETVDIIFKYSKQTLK